MHPCQIKAHQEMVQFPPTMPSMRPQSATQLPMQYCAPSAIATITLRRLPPQILPGGRPGKKCYSQTIRLNFLVRYLWMKFPSVRPKSEENKIPQSNHSCQRPQNRSILRPHDVYVKIREKYLGEKNTIFVFGKLLFIRSLLFC